MSRIRLLASLAVVALLASSCMMLGLTSTTQTGATDLHTPNDGSLIIESDSGAQTLYCARMNVTPAGSDRCKIGNNDRLIDGSGNDAEACLFRSDTSEPCKGTLMPLECSSGICYARFEYGPQPCAQQGGNLTEDCLLLTVEPSGFYSMFEVENGDHSITQGCIRSNPGGHNWSCG